MKRESKTIESTMFETLEGRKMFAAVAPADFCGPLPMTAAEVHTNNATPLLRTMGPVPLDLKAHAASLAATHTANGTPFLRFVGPMPVATSEAQPQDARLTPFVGPLALVHEGNLFGETLVGPMPQLD